MKAPLAVSSWRTNGNNYERQNIKAPASGCLLEDIREPNGRSRPSVPRTQEAPDGH